jgi:type IV secretory pathway TrbL component
MKFNSNAANDASIVFAVLFMLSIVLAGLYLAWRHVPVLGAFFTLLIATPIVAGFWPTKEKK